MTAKDRLELAELLDRWERGDLDAAGRVRCQALSELDRASRYAKEVPPADPFGHFYRERRFEDRRPVSPGLPPCAGCRRTFTPTAPGQELCHECRVPTRPAPTRFEAGAADEAGKVVKIDRGATKC